MISESSLRFEDLEKEISNPPLVEMPDLKFDDLNEILENGLRNELELIVHDRARYKLSFPLNIGIRSYSTRVYVVL